MPVRQRRNGQLLVTRVLSPIVCAGLLGAAAPQPGGLEGVWRNARNTIHLRIASCGEALCATVVWANPVAQADARKGSGQDLIGSKLMTGLRRHPDGKWRGRAYVPDIDKRASATVIQLKEDQLRVSGCMLGGLVCQTRHWQRIG
ncbi:DUF2147 domain-containing protein [Sphingomonas sp. MG17]|uniref:DUF2147 domain-containing protein n=1 Tax=Sphingomonas tagetis TaxID=2949092 RepID=A0A9X2HMB0_9SPHN|nr:DUF2147 domain-containing protein [Sphingomonas tagetis]MCP3731909.1 DUF2147 domain-containing protein [Sphingomonas tagetis]